MTMQLIVIISLLTVYWLILTPTMIYCALKFYQKSNEMIMIKRKPKLTLYLTIISLIGISIYSPMYLYYAYGGNDYLTNTILPYTIPLLFVFSTYTFIYIIVLRFWMIFFDVKWTQKTNDAKWKRFIDQNEEKCWFLTHKTSFGNITYCSKILFIPWFISFVSVCIVDITNDANLFWTIFNFIFMMLPMITITVLWNNTPKINDDFCIIREAKYFCRSAIFFILIYLLIGFSPILGATQFTRYIIGNIIGAINFCVTSLYYTTYPLWIARCNEHKQILTAITTANVVHDYDNALVKVLGEEISFHAFIEHLSSEWSIELIVSYIELVQFKRMIVDMFPAEIAIDDDILNKYELDTLQQCILLNKCIPLSSIIYSGLKQVGKTAPDLFSVRLQSCSEDGNESSSTATDDNHDIDKQTENTLLTEYYNKALLLTQKYIDNGAELQINLPDFKRNAIINKLQNNNREQIKSKDLFYLFDDAMDELWNLLRYSFSRFIMTENYSSLNN